MFTLCMCGFSLGNDAYTSHCCSVFFFFNRPVVSTTSVSLGLLYLLEGALLRQTKLYIGLLCAFIYLFIFLLTLLCQLLTHDGSKVIVLHLNFTLKHQLIQSLPYF